MYKIYQSEVALRMSSVKNRGCPFETAFFIAIFRKPFYAKDFSMKLFFCSGRLYRSLFICLCRSLSLCGSFSGSLLSTEVR